MGFNLKNRHWFEPTALGMKTAIGGALMIGSLTSAMASPPAQEVPLEIFREDFENTAQKVSPPDLTNALTMDEYVSAATDYKGQVVGMTYGAEGNLSASTSSASGGNGSVDGYSGVPFWLNKQYCNGLWLSADASATPYPSAKLLAPYKAFTGAQTVEANPGNANYCQATTNNTVASDAWSDLQVLANVLGQISNPGSGPGANKSNRAIAAFTQLPNNRNYPNTPMIQLKMMKSVPLPSYPGSSGRFIRMSVAMAARNCASSSGTPANANPTFDFYLIKDLAQNSTPAVNPSNLERLTTKSIDVCTSGQQYVNVGTNPGELPSALPSGNVNRYESGARAAQYRSDIPLLVSTPNIALQMVNSNASGQGNDAAFDNLLVEDITPTLSKSFAPQTVINGETTRLTFVVTNTTDNMLKSGWSFADTLPTGMTVASAPNIQHDCGTAVVNAAPGSSTIVMNSGQLNAGATSCQVSVDVAINIPSPVTALTTLRNGSGSPGSAGDTTTVGLNPPAVAELIVLPVADMAATPGTDKTVEVDTPVSITTTCTNVGPEVALAATCVVTGVPTDAADSSTVCTPESGTVDLQPGKAISCTTKFTPKSAGVVNLLTTTGTTSRDVDSTNDKATTQVLVPPIADMQASAPTYAKSEVGKLTSVTTTCTNAGPSTAASANCVVTGAPAGATTVCTPTTPVGKLVLGASISCVTSFTPATAAPITLVTTASSTTPDPDPGNDTASTLLTDGQLADMKSTAPTTVASTPGTPVSVTSVCTNAGPDAAASATCTVTGAPADATTVCTPDSSAASLAVGASISCTTTFTPQDATPVTLTTTAASTTMDPYPANNVASTKVGAVSPSSVPTLGTWGFAVLSLLLGGVAVVRQRRTHNAD
ncbi:IPTL-CTERM sorting domain-containing protein [Diaphorobacter caeni]|uniref:IPTL-CTERM sorting domain-containing protein n=1 Tax=Diaphorobacter caeni TaxID=2784387 RepID=UPI00188E0A7C|nr:IPTL-CTERM sorting domain-containing protein [Diaphorobacter caeni]MBF5003158.1 IPTL-CTERM sorting domain-containing protein [Diaphorobacter caeni]